MSDPENPGMVTQMRSRLQASNQAREEAKKTREQAKKTAKPEAKAEPKLAKAEPKPKVEQKEKNDANVAPEPSEDKDPGMVTQMRNRLAATKDKADAKRKDADEARAKKKAEAATSTQRTEAVGNDDVIATGQGEDGAEEDADKEPGMMTQMRNRLGQVKADAAEKAKVRADKAATIKAEQDVKSAQLAQAAIPAAAIPAAAIPAAAIPTAIPTVPVATPMAAPPPAVATARPAVAARPVPALGARGAEPSTALKNVLDIPLKYSIDDVWASQFDDFSRRVYQTPPEENWVPNYDAALDLIGRLGDDVGQRLEEKQVAILDMTEPAEIKARLSTAPRKNADNIKSELKTKTTKEAKDWGERSKRQLDFIVTSCTQICSDQLLAEGSEALEQTTISGGLKLEVSEEWWKSYQDYIESCCKDWTNNFTVGAEKGLTQVVGETMKATAEFAPLQAIGKVEQLEFVAPSLYLNDVPPPSQSGKVPNVIAAGFQAMRQNLMMIGMMALMLIAPVATFFFDTKVDRKLITLFFIVPVLGYSFFKARTERADQLEKLVTSQKDSVATFIKGQLQKALERHRQGLEKWMGKRIDAHLSGADRYFDTHVEPVLLDGDNQSSDALRALKLEQQRANEELGALRTFRNQLTQQLSLELKKQRRDLVRKQGG